jgi:hypothetical protein
MKSLLFIVVLTAFSSVNAGITFASGESLEKDGVALLKESEDRILLGEVFLSESDSTPEGSDNDTFSLPSCGWHNVVVDQVRLVAPKEKVGGQNNLDAWIKQVVIVFGNGDTRTEKYTKAQGRLKVTASGGDSLAITFGSKRCVRAITVIGEQYEAGSSNANSYVRVVGRK